VAPALRKPRRRAQVLFASGVARGAYAASLLWLASAAASELAPAGHGSLGLAAALAGALVLALSALPAVRGAAEALSPEAAVPATLGFVAGFAAVALFSGTVLPETLSAFVAVAGA
jgi:hypothetical protein